MLLFLLTLLSAKAELFIIDKEYSSAKKTLENYLTTSGYSFQETDHKIFKIYFDTPELKYLKQNGFICYQALQYLSRKKNKIKYKETIAYTKDSNVTSIFSVKHYNNIKTFEGKHPLLTLVKRKERKYFMDQLKVDGMKYPMRLKEIVQVSKISHHYEIFLHTKKVGNISLNKILSSSLDRETEFLILETDMEKHQSVRDTFNIDNQNNLTTEYSLAFKEMQKNINLFSFTLRYPYLVNLFYAIFFALLGVLTIFLLYRKRLLASN